MGKRVIILFLSIFLMMVACQTWTIAKGIPMMTKDQLKSMLGNPDLTIIDVRYGLDWTESDVKIQGAVREDPVNVKSWADQYAKNRLIVLYCA